MRLLILDLGRQVTIDLKKQPIAFNAIYIPTEVLVSGIFLRNEHKILVQTLLPPLNKDSGAAEWLGNSSLKLWFSNVLTYMPPGTSDPYAPDPKNPAHTSIQIPKGPGIIVHFNGDIDFAKAADLGKHEFVSFMDGKNDQLAEICLQLNSLAKSMTKPGSKLSYQPLIYKEDHFQDPSYDDQNLLQEIMPVLQKLTLGDSFEDIKKKLLPSLYSLNIHLRVFNLEGISKLFQWYLYQNDAVSVFRLDCLSLIENILNENKNNATQHISFILSLCDSANPFAPSVFEEIKNFNNNFSDSNEMIKLKQIWENARSICFLHRGNLGFNITIGHPIRDRAQQRFASETYTSDSYKKLVEILRKHHAPSKDPWYPSPSKALRRAAISDNHIEDVKFLAQHGADINAQEENTTTQRTPLQIAIAYKAYGVAKALVEMGAKTDIPDANNKTAVDYAKEAGGEIIAMLSANSKAEIEEVGTKFNI